MGRVAGIEPTSQGSEPGVLSFELHAQTWKSRPDTIRNLKFRKLLLCPLSYGTEMEAPSGIKPESNG